MAGKVLVLTLRIFSATGGIEKVCRVAGKALYEFCTRYQQEVSIYSLHDHQSQAANNNYFPAYNFSAFSAAKASFVLKSIKQGIFSGVVLISHINLLFPAWCIKKLSPKTKIILFAHGIEIWDHLPARKKLMLGCVDKFICVSRFTHQKLQQVQEVVNDKISVINNCLDPFLPFAHQVVPSTEQYRKFKIQPGDKVIVTLTRIATTEQYKGYDDILKAMAKLKNKNIKYVLAGKYDQAEYHKVQSLAQSLGLSERIYMPGFIEDEDIGPLFSMATVYAMPSSKEGFGIVFIEAMYYGLPAIGGNADGSVDALLDGQLGTLVTPGNIDELTNALEKILSSASDYRPDDELLLNNFSYETYKRKLNQLVASLLPAQNYQSHRA